MASSQKRFPLNEWLQRKATIRDLYLTEKRSTNDIVQMLACEEFYPNKHQLEHRLRLWGFNKNVPKSLAEATWRYIGYEIANRTARGEDTEVVLFGQVQDKRKVKVETRRHFRFRYGGEPIPTPPEGVSILLRTPSSRRPIPWPLSLPWLQFQSRYVTSLPLRAPRYSLQQEISLPANSKLITVLWTMIYPPLDSFMSITESTFISLLKATMPESFPDEATSRANIILRGWKRSGVMSAVMIINDSITLLAVREALLQLAFKVILEPRLFAIRDIGAAMPGILRLVKWLLRSGQSPDITIGLYETPIMEIYFGRHLTPLQAAALSRSKYLLAALLEKGANQDPVPPQRISECATWSHVNMPPIFLAAWTACKIDDLGCLDLLFSAGAMIDYHHSPRSGFLSRVTLLSLLAGKEEEAIALDIIKMLTTKSVGIAYLEAAKSSDSADTAISAASRGNLEILKFLHNNGFDVTKANEFGLTALHAAAYEGHIDCCKFLLECGFDVTTYHDSVRPFPIHLACYQNHVEVVKFLHSQGACVNQQLSIPSSSRELVLIRYFCSRPYTYYSSERVAALLTQLGSPIGAALCRAREFYNKNVYPPFHRPASGSREPLVSYLLSCGSIIPPFAAYRAAGIGDKELLSVALAAGADPNYRELDGTTPLYLTLYARFEPIPPGNWSNLEDRIQIGKMLLNAGAEVTRPSYAIRAIRLKDWDFVKEILEHKLLDLPKSSDWRHTTTLLEAALLTGNSCIIQQVLKNDSTSYTPGELCAATLQAAKAVIDPGIVSQLLRYRNPDHTCPECLRLETTAVGIAACYESSEILEQLLSYLPVFGSTHFPLEYSQLPMREALERTISGYGRPFWRLPYPYASVLVYALESNPSVMSKLLNHGYKYDWEVVTHIVHSEKEEQHLNIISDQPTLFCDQADGNEALSLAIRSGDTNLVQSLLKVRKTVQSGELMLGCRDGPLQVAIEVGNWEMFDILIEAGISPYAPASNRGGMTALQAAAIYNRVGLAKRLIDLKVDINAPAPVVNGRTALEGAAEHGRIDLIKLLLHSGVETSGSGQLQYLRAIGYASDNGHHVAANMLKSHRKLTTEDLSILEGKDLFPDYPESFSSDDSFSPNWEDGGESEGGDEDEDEDENNSVNRVNGTDDDDLEVIHSEDTGFIQMENHQALQIGRDETLLFYDDEINEHSLDFSCDIQLRREQSPVLDITAPSEGIYNFDYPLFGVYDTEDPIDENP
ncbi:ankyrin repeat-containing domain protein [Xylaria sp. FL1042]|nr:ankyrin repeat-containing domain protein [Xylaria sp. FL1042]